MNLSSLLTSDLIIPEMEATEHWPAIAELVDCMVRVRSLSEEDREAIHESLQAREENMSTGIGSGVAIPHATSDRVEEVAVVFGRSSKGIDFDAIDNAPVKFLVLFVVPQNQYQLHLRTLAAIAKLFTDCQIRESLRQATTAEEILSILSQRPARR